MLEKKLEIGGVIAHDVSFDDYMQRYAEDHCEWVEGMVVKLSPVTREHDLLDGFLYRLLSYYLEETGAGIIRRQPFVMRIQPGASAREPDLHMVLSERVSIVQETMTVGPADIVIEIVSKESQTRDLIEKYEEYEAGGVREYWLINPLRKQSDFYALGEGQRFRRIEPDNGLFGSLVLPGFRLDVDVLWQDPLPTGRQIAQLVDAMLKPPAPG